MGCLSGAFWVRRSYPYKKYKKYEQYENFLPDG